MSTNQNYNGWTNYETWLVKLWIDNDSGSQERWAESALLALANPSAYFDANFTKAEMAASALEDELKAAHEEALPELQGFAADLLNASMGRVNWREIANSLIGAAMEERSVDGPSAGQCDDILGKPHYNA